MEATYKSSRQQRRPRITLGRVVNTTNPKDKAAIDKALEPFQKAEKLNA